MKLLNWQVGLGTVLLIASALVYTLHYFIFHDAHHIFMFLVSDIAFVFIEVLLVTMILHRLLEVRSKKEKLHKLNMVVGSFYSEIGSELLKTLATFDTDIDGTRRQLTPGADWGAAQFTRTRRELSRRTFSLDPCRADLDGLRTLMGNHRKTILRILENPNMLEHDCFTDMLWAVFHLEDELRHRKSLAVCASADSEHLAGDLERAYGRLICEWLSYMQHLKSDYPYLYSLALRLNPFDPEAKVEIT